MALLGMRVYRQISCLKILIPVEGLLRDIQAEIEMRSLPGGVGRAEMAIPLQLRRLAMH